MMVMACIHDRNETSTDCGNGIGRLQVLLGAGGRGEYFVIDAFVTTLVQYYGRDNDKYSIHATTGKASTSIGGSKFQNYKNSLGLILSSMFHKISPKILRILQNI